ncbi:MAG: bifunctional 4-hydroxy-2-oxoglutarate aldolase/2-dehydro-3-deoxy-phosphogluconate aldolase [Opitutales bacterium]
MSNDVLNALEAARVLPVAVLHQVDDGPRLAEALLEADLNVIEVTLRTPVALEALRAIRSRFPDMIVGAGTVLDEAQVHFITEADLHFAVAPGLDAAVLKTAQEQGLMLLPGVVTPSEVTQAIRSGAQVLKFFPAEPAGGAKYLKALIGPFGHTGVRFVPTGGIQPEALSDYLAIPQVVAVGGSWFVPNSAIKEGDFAKVTALTREALERATGAS